MFKFVVYLLQTIFSLLFKKEKDIIFTILLLKKENEILKRHSIVNNQKLNLKMKDRFILSIIGQLSRRALLHLSIVRPETLLKWQRQFIRKRWTFYNRKKGRPYIKKDIKNLILEMKQDNRFWGCRKISDELNKVDIDVHFTTVNKILQTFRKNGQLKPVGCWKKFLKAHWNSLYSMDFFTIDTLFGKRFYILVILELKSRRIVKFDLTEYPTREFVRQRIIDFSYDYPDKKYLIHDNAAQFTTIDFSQYGITGINTSPYAPNMNAHVERVIGTIRREALDHFLLFTEKQVQKIVKEFVHYYNNFRPHQGINRIPNENISERSGSIRKKSILSGTHHHYFRSSA
ncbi:MULTISPECIES: integrase core domain-containing protein [unclassified Oceanispirochaeta]|uniref:integrase core domain-containing protein n=1 Tax=unclassified Oceanispirochaeta TaxID=2635722 RepID=UPI000E09938E|nr:MULTISPECIES: integrase core domain-containing protein [unclassified Oceanispirochaeta]MBF9018821.1 transposase family protein [Oceanispirochaeta sp. M2]NPD75290.1 transposase family protein [Oceanispirochaeta sp. M1]RDG28850.1 transposase [Oceanispirochaeta sp. M1]